MKTSNVKVKVKHVKQGVTVYTAHPVYGIDKRFLTGKPYKEVHTKSLFVKCTQTLSDGYSFETESSLEDMGITPGNSYNGRRTFFKEKHAVAWIEKWSKDLGFIVSHEQHVGWCSDLDFYLDDDSYDYDYEDSKE